MRRAARLTPIVALAVLSSGCCTQAVWDAAREPDHEVRVRAPAPPAPSGPTGLLAAARDGDGVYHVEVACRDGVSRRYALRPGDRGETWPRLAGRTGDAAAIDTEDWAGAVPMPIADLGSDGAVTWRDEAPGGEVAPGAGLALQGDVVVLVEPGGTTPLQAIPHDPRADRPGGAQDGAAEPSPDFNAGIALAILVTPITLTLDLLWITAPIWIQALPGVLGCLH